jgi:hypothetical protein
MTNLPVGCTIAQAVSRRFLTMKAWVRSQSGSCGIYDWWSAQLLLFFRGNYRATVKSLHSSFITPSLQCARLRSRSQGVQYPNIARLKRLHWHEDFYSKFNRRFGGTVKLFLPHEFTLIFAWLILLHWRWKRHVPPECGLVFNRLDFVIFHETEFFIYSDRAV